MTTPSVRLPVGRVAGTLALLLLSGACAPSQHSAPPPSPAEIPVLEAHLRDRPGDAPALLRLGVAYREAGDPVRARGALERATRAEPVDPLAFLYLGVVHEESERWADARAAYAAALALDPPAEVRRTIEGRMPFLQRQELEADARAALAEESIRSQRPPTAGTVAVFPFRFTGADPDLAPLSRALAELVVTDLSQTTRLTVLERLRVQLLLDELRLAEEGLVDPATAARSGRILGAERIVQGTIDGDEERIDVLAMVARLGTTGPGAPVEDADALMRFFDLEKRLVLALYGSMGVELTPAERERVMRVPTDNIRALLLFGRALEAEDSGDFPLAAELYAQALAEDPDFGAADEGRERTTAIDDALAMTPDVLTVAWEPALPPPSPQAAGPFVDFDALHGMIPAPEGRDATAEFLGREGLAPSSVLLEIILRPPGGGT